MAKQVVDVGEQPKGGGGSELGVLGANVGSEGVALSEEVIWKGKAQDAEEEIARLEAKVVELEAAVEEANASVRFVERRGEIDRELVAAKAIDLETARLLTEATIGEMDAPDVGIAVRELCDRKPFLFASRRGSGHAVGGVSMGPAGVGVGVDDEIEQMASSARSSGDRSELLRYLRVRRGQ